MNGNYPYKRRYMRRFFQAIVALVGLLAVAEVEAQTIALGERTPRFKHAKWLNGNEPKRCDYAYIEFIHSASIPCRKSAERIYQTVGKMDNVAFVLISHQSAAEIDSWVTAYTDHRSGVVVEDEQIRHSFGVNYAPFAVILDHKRRALWFGNPQLLDKQTIEQLISEN